MIGKVFVFVLARMTSPSLQDLIVLDLLTLFNLKIHTQTHARTHAHIFPFFTPHSKKDRYRMKGLKEMNRFDKDRKADRE